MATSILHHASLLVPSSTFSGIKNVTYEGLSCQQRLHVARKKHGSAKLQARPSRQTVATLIEYLPKEFGYVAATAAASAFLTQWQMVQVALQRKRSNVAYPKMYEDAEPSVFNCYQRAHHNTLEAYPAFLTLLLLAGLAYPRTASGLGMGWVVARVLYSLGYYSGDPNKRHIGSWNNLCLYGLMITVCRLAVGQAFGV